MPALNAHQHEREDCYAEITATAAAGKVSEGSAVLPHVLASPTGSAGVPRAFAFVVDFEKAA